MLILLAIPRRDLVERRRSRRGILTRPADTRVDQTSVVGTYTNNKERDTIHNTIRPTTIPLPIFHYPDTLDYYSREFCSPFSRIHSFEHVMSIYISRTRRTYTLFVTLYRWFSISLHAKYEFPARVRRRSINEIQK